MKNANSQIFRSPSIYENNPSNNSSAGDQNPDIENNHHMTASDEIDENKQQNTVMNRYLSGKFCPLTPSQQPTNVSHLVEANEKGPTGVAESGAGGPWGGGQGAGGAGGAHSTALVPASPTLAMTNYCSIM